jgi:hypothetical protein
MGTPFFVVTATVFVATVVVAVQEIKGVSLVKNIWNDVSWCVIFCGTAVDLGMISAEIFRRYL